MTSRNSFWASSKENHKRRIWVWVVSVLLQLMAYVGILTVYLSRIRRWNSEGIYQTFEQYQNAMYQAAKDALGFQDNMAIALIVLAVIIGMHGFSYLYDRRKVDLYHSVPVDKNRRFMVVYVNGIIIYLASTLVSILFGVITATVQGAVNGEVMAVVGLGFVWNLLFFLVMYHTAIFAVMVTGSWFITFCVGGGLILYEQCVYSLADGLKYSFFKTVSGFYVTYEPKFSALADYFNNIYQFKSAENVQSLAKEVLPYYGKWFILAVVVLAAAWLCYRKRPSEAAGKAIAFPKLEPVFKVAAVLPVGIGLGMWVHSAAYGSMALTAGSMVVFGAIACAFVEVIYDFDIKSMFKHLLSSGVAVAGIAIVFIIFRYDVFGYDKYIPDAGKVDSIALSVDYYGEFWNADFNYIGVADFSEEHMYLKDVEPVLALARKSQDKNVEEIDNYRPVDVLYRLKSGRKAGRRFYVDFGDPASEELMNRIVGTLEFKEGTYQIMTDTASYDKALSAAYSNGATNVALPAADAQALREAYVKDMEKVDFTLLSKERPCGRLTFRFPNWRTNSLDVYDSFENTIAYLQSQEAFYPVMLNPADIADITVTNYHNELNEAEDPVPVERYADTHAALAVVEDVYYEGDNTVTETFLKEEELEQITRVMYPAFLSSSWNDSRELDDNYDIYVTFRKDTSYPYDRGSYGAYYRFYTDKAPEFVAEATALENSMDD